MLSPRGAFTIFGGVVLIAFGFAATQMHIAFTTYHALGGGKQINIPEELPFFLLLMGCIMILSTVIGIPIFRLSADPRSVVVTRKIDREKVFAGDYVFVEVTMKNTGLGGIDLLEVYDAYPQIFELALGENWVLTKIEGGQEVSFAYVLRALKRGKYLLGPSKVIVKDRLGLFFEEEIKEGNETELIVYPPYEDIAKMMVVAKKRLMGRAFGIHKTRAKGIGSDFFAIREYVTGDEFRRIDWKSFARKGNPMVRDYEDEKSLTSVIFLDCSGSMGGGPPANSKLEYAIRSAVLLTHLAFERSDPVGLCIFSDKVRAWVKPGKGQRKFYEILEALAIVEPGGGANIEGAMEFVLSQVRKAGFFMVISDLEHANIEKLTKSLKQAVARNNSLTVLAPFGPFFEVKVGTLSPVEKALAEAVAEEYFGERAKVIKELQKAEIETISVGPDDILSVVIDTWIKQKRVSGA